MIHQYNLNIVRPIWIAPSHKPYPSMPCTQVFLQSALNGQSLQGPEFSIQSCNANLLIEFNHFEPAGNENILYLRFITETEGADLSADVVRNWSGERLRSRSMSSKLTGMTSPLNGLDGTVSATYSSLSNHVTLLNTSTCRKAMHGICQTRNLICMILPFVRIKFIVCKLSECNNESLDRCDFTMPCMNATYVT